MSDILKLPQQAQDVIDAYAGLDFGHDRLVACPYFINKRAGRRMQIPALVGKGTPEEIIEEVKVHAKMKRLDFAEMSAEEIEGFMRQEGIGVDCSGFLAHVMRAYVFAHITQDLFRLLRQRRGLLSRILFRMHPEKNINVALLASEANSEEVLDVNDILPGDFVISKNEEHVYIVSEVYKEGDSVKKLHYWQSGEKENVCDGSIVISDSAKPLLKQTWEPEQELHGQAQVRRLKCVQ